METQENTVNVLLPPTRHPLSVVCAAFVLGTWIGMRFCWLSGLCAALGFSSAFAWIIFRRASGHRRVWQGPALIALFLAVGSAACWSAQQAAQRDFDAVELFRDIIESREDALLRGRVLTEPSVTTLEHGGARIRFTFAVKEVPFEDGSVTVPNSFVQVDWYGPESLASRHPPFRIPHAGEGWQLAGRMREVKTRAAVPLVTMRIGRSYESTHRFPSGDASSAMTSLYEMCRYAGETLSIGMDGHEPEVAIVKAMTLGLRSDVSKEVMDFFKLSGTIHVFSISGLHVAIVASILLVLLSALPIRRSYKVFFYGPLIIAYTVATGAEPSAIRACVMSLILFSAPLMGRRIDAVSSLSAAAILILAFDPRQVVDLGFIFSFVSAAGIIVLVPVLNCLTAKFLASIVAFWRGRRPQSVAEAIDVNGLPKGNSKISPSMFRRVVEYLPDSMAVSLAAWAASTPITAMYFARITPVSILCNLAIIPLSFLVVVVAALSLFTGLFSPWAAEIFNQANLLIVWCLVWVAKVFSQLPYASFETSSWGVVPVLAWYGGMVVLYFVGRSRCR